MIIDISYKERRFKMAIHGKKKKNVPVDSFSRRLFLKKTFHDLDRLEESLAYVNRDLCVLDCGANIGNHTVFYSNFCKKVYAFEPFASNYELLVKNIEMNNCNAEAFNVLLSNNDKDRFTVKANEKSYAATRFVPDKKGKFVAKRLDSLVQNDEVGFMKVDVEGAELSVLEGAEEILDRDHPNIFVEIHFFDDKKLDKKVLNYLSRFNYIEGKDLIVFRRKKK